MIAPHPGMGEEGEGRYQKSQVMRHGLLTVVDVL